MSAFDKPQQVLAAAERFVVARRARIAAKRARAKYWRDAYPENYDPTTHAGANGWHPFGSCPDRVGDPDPTEPLCDVCEGSRPVHQALLAANQAHGNALRSLMRLVKP